MASIPLEIQIMVARKAAKQLSFKIIARLSLLNKTWYRIANDIMDNIIAKKKVLNVDRGNVSMFKKSAGWQNLKIFASLQTLNFNFCGFDRYLLDQILSMMSSRLDGIVKLDIDTRQITPNNLHILFRIFPNLSEFVYRIQAFDIRFIDFLVYRNGRNLKKLALIHLPLSFRKSVGTILRLRYLEELDIQFANIQMMDDGIRELLDQDIMGQITLFAGWRYHTSIPFHFYLRKLLTKPTVVWVDSNITVSYPEGDKEVDRDTINY